MEWQLYNGETKATVSSKGGYVTNLANGNGDILFPKRTLKNTAGEDKTRGGCHVCMPNFGPDGGTGLGQHGYGRNSEWTLVSNEDTSVTLALAGQGDYADLRATLHYELAANEFTSTLTLRNGGQKPLPVSPAFHPYFNLGGQKPELDGETHEDLAEFEGTLFIDGDSRLLGVANRTLSLTSINLARWAIWTDQLGDYFCVEPTQAGYAFAEDISRGDVLEQNQEKTYNYTIKW